MKGRPALSHNPEFCALQYMPRGRKSTSAAASPVVLLVHRSEDGRLRILVHPERSKIIRSEDLDYIESLFQDLPERAKIDPDLLFEQLCHLGVGPLRTKAVGPSIDDNPLFLELSLGFIEL